VCSAHDIRQLAYRYAFAHDSHDLEEMARIFVAADTPLSFPDFNLANLRETMPAYWQVAGPTMLFVANHLVEIADGDHATGSVYCLAKLDIAGSWIERAVLYQDVYERRDGSGCPPNADICCGTESSCRSAPSSSPRRYGRLGQPAREACPRIWRRGGRSTGSLRRRPATTASQTLCRGSRYHDAGRQSIHLTCASRITCVQPSTHRLRAGLRSCWLFATASSTVVGPMRLPMDTARLQMAWRARP
jgi:SnoaL-like domain